MSDYCAFNHKEWESAGLKDFEDFSDCVEYVNQDDDYGDCLRGEWFYADDDTMTIYSGSFGNYNVPGASSYTFADTFTDKTEYLRAVANWEACDEYLEDEDGDNEDGDSEE